MAKKLKEVVKNARKEDVDVNEKLTATRCRVRMRDVDGWMMKS